MQSITLLVILGTPSNYINEMQFTVSCSFPLGSVKLLISLCSVKKNSFRLKLNKKRY